MGLQLPAERTRENPNLVIVKEGVDRMRILSTLLLVSIPIVFGTPVRAQEVDWQKVDDAFGRKAALVAGDVHRYDFPRTDLSLTLDGVAIKPALALIGWVTSSRCTAKLWPWATSCCSIARSTRS